MSAVLTLSNILLAAGATLLSIALIIKIKHFYYGGKSEYFEQFAYSGTALVTISLITLIVLFVQYQVPAQELIMSLEELRSSLGF